jgi:hypothetical protein
VAAAGANVGGGDEELDRRARKPLEIDAMGENVAQWIGAHRVEIIGRENPRHEIHGDEGGRIIERPAAKNHIERRTLEGAQLSRVGDFAPNPSIAARAPSGPLAA